MTEVIVKQVEGSTFLAKGLSNHWVAIDADESEHGSDAGARPMELLLMGLGGCMGIDIELMLTKMRVKVDRFEMEIRGTRPDDPPRYYNKIHTVFHFWGTDLPLGKLQKAVELSEEKYCSVYHSLRQDTAKTSEIKIHLPVE